MGGVVDDIVNPGGAITGIDPVKSATGFNGTGFDPKTGAPTGSTASGGGGGNSSGGGQQLAAISGQVLNQQQQQVAQQNNQFSQFGQQLAQLQPQPVQSLPPVASPSANQLAANVTAQAVNAKMQSPFKQQQPFWQMQ